MGIIFARCLVVFAATMCIRSAIACVLVWHESLMNQIVASACAAAAMWLLNTMTMEFFLSCNIGLGRLPTLASPQSSKMGFAEVISQYKREQ